MIKKKVSNDKGYTKTITTMVNTDVIIEGGTLRSTETIRFAGTCRGDIICEGALIVGETGRVEGNIQADNLLFCGYIKGNIKTTNECHLGNSCTVEGNIECGSFVVDEGACFEGQCKMVKESKKSAKKIENTQDKKVG